MLAQVAGIPYSQKLALVNYLLPQPSPQGKLDRLSWTLRYRRMLDLDTPFSLYDHPYLVDIYRDETQVIVMKKAAQMGASEWGVTDSVYVCDQLGGNVMYIMPTDADVSDFSQSRFAPAIEASEYLNSIVISHRSDARGTDKVTLKRIRNAYLFLRSGTVKKDGRARQLKSVPSDEIILDEVDELDPRAPEIGRKRLGHSLIARERYISTPTYPGYGIDVLWNESDQSTWQVKCQSCGHWQDMTIYDVVTEWDSLERPVRWHGQEEGKAWVACRKCGRRLNRLARGVWVQKYPGRSKRGYHLSKLFSGRIKLLQVVENLQQTNETKRREVYNQDLGETYTPRGGQLTPTILDGCRREYLHGPMPGETTWMGVDVGSVLHVVVRAGRHKESGERPQRWAGEADSFEELGRLMRRFAVDVAVIDALPETRSAREFQAHWSPGRVWLAYYDVAESGNKKIETTIWNEGEGTVTIDRTRSLDETFARFYDKKNTLPADARDLPDYYKHLCSLVRKLEERKGGKKVAIYIESGADADHYAHAENYCMAAMLAPKPPDYVPPVTVSTREVLGF